MCNRCENPEFIEEMISNDGVSCTFGCGFVVDSDTGFCPRCKDHSANSFVCDDCGAVWEDWGFGYETTWSLAPIK